MLDTRDIGPASPQASDPSPTQQAPPPLRVHLAARRSTPIPGEPHASTHYGIAPLNAVVVISVDFMCGGLEITSAMLFAVVTCVIGALLVLPCTVIQVHAFKDNWLLAAAKGFCLGLLVAIPTPIPSFLVAAWGFQGAAELKRRNDIH
ncbi:MAG: hypothetical protein ABTD50_23960 [Polyangiaceae bacterium]|jgi:hypothetical protein